MYLRQGYLFPFLTGNGHFNVIVNDALSMKDMNLSIRLKGVTGEHDKGGGFIWRFTDKDNYYVVRSNPEEDNVVLYKRAKADPQ